MRKGFTLAEVIVALGIVGVIAAITSPMLASLVPDKDKLMVLKTYKLVMDINDELVNDPGFYNRFRLADDVGPLLDTTTPEKARQDDTWRTVIYRGQSKYAAMLAKRLKTKELRLLPNSTNSSFTTEDGTVWQFTAERDFYIDINPEGDDCDSSECRKPDRFCFTVDAYGRVSGDDPLTIRYLETPEKLNDKKADYRAAGLR